MNKTKNDEAWRLIFKKHEVLDEVSRNSFFEITSTQINEFREARLMTKFDHKSQLPALFAKHRLSILPTSRGGYIIGGFQTFCDFKIEDVAVSPVKFPSFLESLDHKDITSEATAINCAFVSEILRDFTGEERLFPTVSGRMGSSSFSFDIDSQNGLFRVNVENSQVEIDAGYEGDDSLFLIEAKNYISDDFLVRQLYYPYKLWSEKIRKRVRPIFLTYTNGIFHLREYDFTDAEHYNSLVLVKQRRYIIQENSFNLEVLSEILDRTEVINEPTIPFPQADDFKRIINLCELLKQRGFMSKEEITESYDFAARQTDYYSGAARYLGLIQSGPDPLTGHAGCFLTEKGKQIFEMSLPERQKGFVKTIVSYSVFNKVLKNYLEHGEMPSEEIVVEIMKSCGIHDPKTGQDYSEETYKRRFSTISNWTNWIVGQIDE